MRKIKYIIVLLLCLCLNVKAEDSCSTTEMKRLRELANNVDIKYTYKLETELDGEIEYKYYLYKLNVINFSDDLTLVYENDKISKEELEEMEFLEGYDLEFNVYSYTENLCTHKNLRTISLKLPFYNDYYATHKEECENNPNFKYCKEMLDKKNELSEEEIDKLFSEYKNENKEEVKKDELKLIDYIKENKIVFLAIGLLVIIIVIVIVIVIKKRKNKDI